MPWFVIGKFVRLVSVVVELDEDKEDKGEGKEREKRGEREG